MNYFNLLIALLVTGLVFLLMTMFIKKRRQRGNIVRRMEYFSGIQDEANLQLNIGRRVEVSDHKATIKEKFLHFIQNLTSKIKSIHNTSLADQMDLKMEQADWPLLGSEFLVLLMLLAVLGGTVAGLLTFKLAPTVIGATGSVLFMIIILRIRIDRRRKAFTNQLGDMLTMVANALRAGFSFLQAFELIAREMDDPVRSEVNKVVREIGIGISLEKALENMSKRMSSSEFNLVVTAVLIQRQVGGNMAQILDNISNTITERIRMKREVMALTAQGRASGVVLAALPFGAAALLSAINPGYLDPLIESGTGRMAILVAIIMEILGWLSIEKIVNIEM